MAYTCKRLRGWELEKESGMLQRKALGKAPAEPERESQLATKLLSLWAHGMLSAILVRELADLALQDKADHVELVALAKTGNWGSQKGNVHKQIMHRFCKHITMPDPFHVSVSCIDPKTSKETKEDAAIFLPHLVFAGLGKDHPEFFEEMCHLGKGELEEFWEGVKAAGDDRLNGHPMTLEKEWESYTVPLFLHGDGVEFQNRDSLLVFSWGTLLSSMNSLQNHMLVAAWPKSCQHPDTWDPIWKWVVWSLEALGKGFQPMLDPDNNPLKGGLEKLKGQPLHPSGFKAVLWAVIGDQEYFANVLKLAHWASHYPCWECDAQNFEGAAPGKHVKEICLEKQDFYIYNQEEHQEYLETEGAWESHPLFHLPGLTQKMVRGDALHILFTKGIYGHLIGSILHYACWYEGPGKVASKPAWERLACIFDQVQVMYQMQETTCRLTNLKLSMFTDTKKPWKSWANLDCKGGEAKHLLPVLAPVLEKIFGVTMTPAEQKMIACVTSLGKLVQLWDESGTFPTEESFALALSLGKGFLDDYQWLNQWSKDCGRKSFHIVHKHHSFMHLLYNSRYMNPKAHWCFKAEDYVGHISRLTHSISMGVRSTKLSQKLCPKYRVLLHLLLTRAGFAQECHKVLE